MSYFIKQLYQCSDGQTWDDLESAWNYERRIKYPNIKIFDCFGNAVEDVRIASDYVVNNETEAEFVDDLLRDTEDAIVYNMERAVPGSWITTAEFDDNYMLYPPEDYKEPNHDSNFEIHERLRQDCDLWHELLGQ